MELTAEQVVQYERDGFLIFPELFAAKEVAVLRSEVERVSRIDSESPGSILKWSCAKATMAP